MAKKKENIRDNEKKTTAKRSPATQEDSAKPHKSGEVKGPMGVGGRKKADDMATPKDPAKNSGPSGGDIAKNKVPSSSQKKSTPEKKKGLPKGTSKTIPAKAKTGSTKKKDTSTAKSSKKPTKFYEPLTDEALPTVAAPASDLTSSPDEEKKKKRSIQTKEAIKASEDPSSRRTATKASENEENESPKKMSRLKADPTISAEEKMKLPNTSPTEDLKDTVESLAREMAEKLSPDEKKREEIEKMARDLIPDSNDVKAAAEKLTAALASTPEKAQELMKKIIPAEEDLSEMAKKAKDLAFKAAPTTEEKQKSSKEKPVEATLITDYDVHLFKEGKHYHLYKKFGSHLMEYMGTEGVYFAVWAPNADNIAVMGDFNNWSKETHMMNPRWDHSGIWEVFIPEAKKGSLYKYFIRSKGGFEAEKGDPFAFSWEMPPNTASMVWDLENTWKDKVWMEERSKKEEPKPYSVYEIHLGSWKRVPEDGFRSLTYRELAADLPAYLQDMGFTHVEFMPVMEHPFFGSWGYQITGYFAPSSRFGNPQDFMYLIDSLHQAGIGVILDWVPSHFPSDLHGLHYFDGTYLYEHSDPKKGFHPDWQSYIFNYGRNEVRAFLISNALFWLDIFHADGLRVDAVASMLYLDYSRNEGEWEPNKFGGRENLEAISFLKEFNEAAYKEFPDIITIAEESTAWPMVSKPTYIGGLGFGQKWMMGWMHDTLEYFSKDPIHRRHHQNTITFSSNYAFSENFMLPLSHDEVVYGKGSILNKMPGDSWNKFANLRSLYSYMYAHPGSKLLFMGAEFGQLSEWNHDGSLEWHLTSEESHRKLQETLKELNRIYKSEPALYEKAFSSEGFEWVDINDEENSIISFLRKGKDVKDKILVVCNFTPVPRENYRVGVYEQGNWKEIFNSDDEKFGGSNVKNKEVVEAQSLPAHRKDFSLALTLPPMAVIYLKEI